ncbi:9481_t:CDS:2, partial [Racocetra fulgida]
MDIIEYDNESVDEYMDQYLEGEGEGSGGHHVRFVEPEKETPQYYMEEAKQALIDLKTVIKEPGWKKMLSNKYTTVYSKLGSLRNQKLPVFMGQCEIRGFDVSLVEKVEWTPNGTIYFVFTSVNTIKIPPVAGRIRSALSLSGWILEPISSNPPSTKVTYILQLHVRGWIPSVVAKKYLARRPLIINKIYSYLQKHGAPEMSLPPTPTESKHTTLLLDNNELSNNKILEPLAAVDKEQDEPKSNNEEENSKLIPKDLDQPPVLLSPSELTPSIHQPTSSSENHPKLPRPESKEPIVNQLIPLSENHLKSPREPKPESKEPTVNQPISSSENHSKLPREPKSEAKELIVKKAEYLHPHHDSALKALELLKSLAKDQTGWELYSENKGIKVYQRENPSRPLPSMRGDVTIYGNFLPDDVLSYATSLGARKFMIDRDPDGTVWFATTSIVDPKIPENKKYVRAELILAGWELRPVYASAGNRIAVDVKYIVDTDIKLESIPTRILKSISMQTPMCVAKIDELMKKIGFPPYVLYTTGTIIEEGFNPESYQYDSTILNTEEKRITELRISNKMYPNGFNISIIPKEVKVDLNPDDKEIIRIVVPVDINAEKLQIKLVKNTSNDQITCNGKRISKMKSKSEIKDNELSRSIKTNPAVTRMQSVTIQNSNFPK